jgi:flagellar motor switch protein FliM
VLDELEMSLGDVMNLKVGQTIMLNATPESPVNMKCGGIPMVRGKIGRVGPTVAVKVDRKLIREKGLGV